MTSPRCLGLSTLTAGRLEAAVSRPSSLISSSILHPLSRNTENINIRCRFRGDSKHDLRWLFVVAHFSLERFCRMRIAESKSQPRPFRYLVAPSHRPFSSSLALSVTSFLVQRIEATRRSLDMDLVASEFYWRESSTVHAAPAAGFEFNLKDACSAATPGLPAVRVDV